jgi:hypothetical protein
MKDQNRVATRSVIRVSLLISFLTMCNFVWAQAPNNDLPLGQFKLAKQNIPAYHQQFLSSTALNMFQLVDALSPDQQGPDGGFGAVPQGVNVLNPALIRNPQRTMGVMTPGDSLLGSSPSGPVPVSNPDLDFVFSAIAGFTQSETSSAWCGNNMVVGFNDSGSFLETLSSRARSFSGAAFSVDGGATFTDIQALNPGANIGDFIEGDPVVACTSNRRFLYTNLFATSTPTVPRQPLTAISLSTSNNSGHTWSAPVAAVSKSALNHFLDKDWMTVDPNSPLRTYITYTDFDFSLTSTACPGAFRNAIELVSSTNGGVTFSAPVVIKEACGGAAAVQGSNIAVAGDGSVYVAFEFFQGLNREIHIRKSADHGATFGPEITISSVVPTGGGGLLQGGFRTNEFPSLAVDLSSGNVYAAFTSANNVALDSFIFTGYGYGDVEVSRSADGGMTWTTPTIVSPVDPSFTGIGRDQFMPGAAVDSTGKVAVCYYDRRNDPNNIAVDRFCSVSTDHASSFTDQQVTLSSWMPFHATDRLINLVYMGDYDALTTDSTRANPGFFGAFQIQNGINPDVFGNRF